MSWFKKKSDDDVPSLPSTVDSVSAGSGRPSQAIEIMTENFRQYTTQLGAVSDQCWEKCIVKKGQAELTIGELSCNDRCVLKYLATTTKVAETFQQLMQQAGQGAPVGPPAQ